MGATGSSVDHALSESRPTRPAHGRSTRAAGTYGSGALNGVTHGNECAQVTSVHKNNAGDLPFGRQTITPIGTMTGTEKCARGHTPGPLDSDVGSARGVFVVAARPADNDGF